VDHGIVYYQRDSGHIHPGDIILMHFRDAFPDDFTAALNAIYASGLTPARLSDYVRIGNPPPTTAPPAVPTTGPPTALPTESPAP
jgi:hypothetical protein